ncbi:MAG: GNAT family N-acetyltransferase [Anaerolineae bacterium]|nr:GNAT family N-acetyltransferase [Anaerolineae bacterium]
MLTNATPYSQPLANGLILKSVSTAADVERLAAFNAHIHGAETSGMCRALILDHPDTRPEHWLFVEEDASQRIISSLCLIPWRWQYEGIELRSGEMGFCGTLEEYRNRGLVRTLMQRHRELLNEGGYEVSNIQGIPYFYRQFGYEYALPLEGGWRLGLDQIPVEAVSQFHICRADVTSIPSLSSFYEAAASDLALSTKRDEATWRYLLDPAHDAAFVPEYWLISDNQQAPIGYVAVQRGGFGEGLNVSEVSRLNSAAVTATLNHLRQLAIERSKPFIRLIPAGNSSLIRLAMRYGAQDQGRYAWQLHLPDAPRLLQKLGPVLERRLAASAFADLSEDVTINLYRTAITLHFERGKLKRTESGSAAEYHGSISIPPLLLAPLIFGWRTADELAACFPDFSVWGRHRYLIDVLFPKMESFLYTIY